ncbi:hypothetical protein WJX74_002359 [Apatococcus lobatus]|uniref:GDT1 family protein n=1 Tax=Apatococcus lobatus TaxID=904363 RepID=A0AAW1Q6N7_9CHLO
MHGRAVFFLAILGFALPLCAWGRQTARSNRGLQDLEEGVEKLGQQQQGIHKAVKDFAGNIGKAVTMRQPEGVGIGSSTSETITIAEGIELDHGFVQAFLKSFLMIMFTELGDETFIIAAIMAMRYPRLVVYAGAMAALASMTVISTALGFVLPGIFSRQLTHQLASVLYTVFGVRLLWIAWRSKPQASNQEEVEEVQAKLTEAETTPTRGQLRETLRHLFNPVFLEALILTFIAEWGDRSQIATITLAADYNPYGVTVGAVLGHCICTGTAVLGGQLIAMKISQRTVAVCGGLLFLAFAVHNIFFSSS